MSYGTIISMNKTRVFIVDYASSAHPGTCELDYTSVLRSEAVLRALKKYPHAKIILGAGMRNIANDCGTLSDMMSAFLMNHGVSRLSILRNPLGHNTLTETEAAYEIIQKHGGGKVVCATSRYHKARVWCIWFFRFGIRPEIYETKLKMTRKGNIKEMIKVPIDAMRAFTCRFI